jgi:uncharacterized repeat protein (TIGR01451 family)
VCHKSFNEDEQPVSLLHALSGLLMQGGNMKKSHIKSMINRPVYLLACLSAAATSLIPTASVSALELGPPIIVQRQFSDDNNLTTVLIHNLGDESVVPIASFGTAGGYCPFDALECETSRMAIGDVTGDGDENLVTTEPTLFSNEEVVIYDQGGLVMGRFDLPDGDAEMLAVGNLSGDARAEIVVEVNGVLQLYNETGTLLGAFTLAAYDEILAADVDDDGFAELVVRRGSFFDFIDPDGTVASNLSLAGTEITTFTIGDPDGDNVNELLVVIPDVDVFESSAVQIREIATGTEESSFTVTFRQVLEVFSSDLVGGAEHEILLVARRQPTISEPEPTGADLIVADGTGTILATRFFIYPREFEFALSPRGPSRLIVGHQTYPDRDMDSLLDSWETNGVHLQGVNLDLPALGADPDHKDLFVELDWMSDPSLPETGRGGSPSFGAAQGGYVGGTCGDSADNDGDGDVDAADSDCIDPRRTEDTPGGCGDGVDNDGDGLVDGADTDCLVGDASLDEGGAGPGTCGDGIDNDNDGSPDTTDSDCRAVDTSFPEGGFSNCGDGFDNDGDGDMDAADEDCYQAGFDEAAANSCGDGFDNNDDGLIDANDPVCAMSGVTQSEIRKMVQAFCAAPGDAGVLRVANPDGLPGIRLHMDMGNLMDGNGIESDIGPCTCGDGIDNDGNGAMDAGDPSCLVFDPSADEGEGFGSCNDSNDNDVDGLTDDDDPDCLVAEASRAETPVGSGSCADGIDNDGDNQIDLADPNCLVGDPLNTDGGNLIALQQICQVGDDFYNLKGSNFDGSNFRSHIFRYGMTAQCTEIGGQAEIGGNDFFAANDDAGTIMHELGHTLNLRHGGNENDNCKPNHVSLMNYDLQFGIPRRAGGSANAGGTRVIYDFSPPRFPGGRGIAPLQDLLEDALDETVVLDATDWYNQSVFSNGAGQRTLLDLDGDSDGDRSPDGIDWDGDGSISGTPVQANINDGTCESSSSDSTLSGHDDWHRVSLSPFTSCGDPDGVWEGIQDLLGACLNEDGAINPVVGPEPTFEDMLEQTRELNLSDLVLLIGASENVVEVGDEVTYTAIIRNEGPNPARSAALDVTLPDLGSLPRDPHGCTVQYPEMDCLTDAVAAERSRSLDIVIGTEGACIAGIPQPLTVRATVQNGVEGAAPDPAPDDNRARRVVETKDTTPPVIECNAPATIVPPDGLDEDEPTAEPVSFTATATDVCDASVAATILDFDCYAIKGKDKQIDKTESCVVEYSGDTIIILNGGGIGTEIVWAVEATDEAGNVAIANCGVQTVKKPHP